MKNEALFNKSHESTYCPEDDKIRLYVGRVPRDEYEALRKEGWTSTPKQSCDFVAVWTPSREDTALSYAGYIGDEDQGPAERAADRAERFAGYRDNRLKDAGYFADKYDDQPLAHGFQDPRRAERAAARHDRQADHAVNNWEKAEYWTSRTAGVISNALHKASPGVRMGRIKGLESDVRRLEAGGYSPRWLTHYKNRLAYENQMLEATGGRAGVVEMEIGGTFKGGVIAKINKSTVTGRVVSVAVIVPKTEGWVYKITNTPGTEFALMAFEVERAAPEAYQPPTDASREKLTEYKEAVKAAKAKKPATPPILNLTDEDAERLQAVWIAENKGYFEREDYGGKKKSVLRMTQAEYSARSKGSFSHCETKAVRGGGSGENVGYFGAVARVRCDYKQIIILTDKPQKPAPAEFWADKMPELYAETAEHIGEVYELARGNWAPTRPVSTNQNPEKAAADWKLWGAACVCGLAHQCSQSQFGLTDKGREVLAAVKEETAVVA